MRFFLSNIKKDLILNALLYLLAGMILLFYPIAVTTIVCYVLGAILLLYGAILLHQYFSGPLHSGVQLFLSIVLFILGAFVLLRSALVISMIPFLMGVVFLFNGLREIQYACSLKDAGYPKWQLNLLLALLLVIAALVLLLNPFAAAAMAVRFIGFLLIYNALSQFWTIHCLSSHVKDFFQ